MNALSELIRKILAEALQLFLEMSPYILLGALMAGVLHVLLKREWVFRHIGRGWKAVWLASLFGVPLPLCSCGVVPAARFLKKEGASPASVVSFLISTPQTGIDSLIATGGLMGPFMAVYRAVAAFFSGILGGTVSFLAGGREGQYPGISDPSKEKPSSLKEKIREMFRYAFGETMEDLVFPLGAGLLAAAILSILIPPGFLADSPFSRGIPGMLLMGLMGIPLYVCSTSSIPIALVLMAKGVSPGAAFVFLMTGPATNAASLAVFIKTLGIKQTAIYLLSIFGTALASGMLLDLALPLLPAGFGIAAKTSESGESAGFRILEIAAALVLGSLLLRQFYFWLRGKLKRKNKEKEPVCSGQCSCQANSETSE